MPSQAQPQANGASAPKAQVAVTLGQPLRVDHLVAISQRNAKVQVCPDGLKRLRASEAHLTKQRLAGHPMYGVNVPFGAMAFSTIQSGDRVASLDKILTGLLYGDTSQSMPAPWVRASLALRAHGFLNGHSAVREEVLRSFLALLEHDVLPVIPLRGSISASGE